MKIISTSVAVSLFVIMSGCDPSVEEVEEHNTLEIEYFSVIAAPGATAYDFWATPISPYYDSGNFLVQWAVTTDRPYQIDLYVSNDPWLGPQDPWGREDVHFKQFYRGVGTYADHALYLDTVTMDCRFSEENDLSCGRISYENPGRDLTPFLTTLPKAGYIILRVCDDLLQACTTMARSVEFQ